MLAREEGCAHPPVCINNGRRPLNCRNLGKTAPFADVSTVVMRGEEALVLGPKQRNKRKR